MNCTNILAGMLAALVFPSVDLKPDFPSGWGGIPPRLLLPGMVQEVVARL